MFSDNTLKLNKIQSLWFDVFAYLKYDLFKVKRICYYFRLLIKNNENYICYLIFQKNKIKIDINVAYDTYKDLIIYDYKLLDIVDNITKEWALATACFHNHYRVVKLILNTNIIIYKDNEYPLKIASIYNCYESIVLLIEYGAIFNNFKKILLKRANLNRNIKLIDFLHSLS